MATGWNPSQATCYLELSSDAWLAVYKDPCSTEWIKPTSIAFPSSAKDFWIELTQDQPPLQRFGQLCPMVHAMFERGCQPLGLSYLKAVIKRKSLKDSSVEEVPSPSPTTVFKNTKTSSQSRLLKNSVFPVYAFILWRGNTHFIYLIDVIIFFCWH